MQFVADAAQTTSAKQLGSVSGSPLISRGDIVDISVYDISGICAALGEWATSGGPV
jgi:hypothetical protein